MAYGAKVQQLIAHPTGGLGRAQLALLKEAAITACDARDGVSDRVVEDPLRCTFDPGALTCTATNSSGMPDPRPSGDRALDLRRRRQSPHR